jgi:hypothetical protein
VEDTENIHDNQYPVRNLNSALPEYKKEAILLGCAEWQSKLHAKRSSMYQ